MSRSSTARHCRLVRDPRIGPRLHGWTPRLRTADEIHELIRFSDSYGRLPDFLDYRFAMTREVFFEVLGDIWQCCDNIGLYKRVLRPILREASRAELDLMMTAEERSALAAMPDSITVFRGCYAVNRLGLSWTTDVVVARTFPTYHRYRRPNDEPLLLQAKVAKSRAVLKLGRCEREVIATDPKAVVELPFADDAAVAA